MYNFSLRKAMVNHNSNILVSIIIPCYNEGKYIESCLHTLWDQDFPMEKAEIICIDGNSTDQTRSIILKEQSKHSNLRLMDNTRQYTPFALNIGIKAAKGEYIVRIDAHAIYPRNYISMLLHYLDALPGAVNVGAVLRTLAANNSMKAHAITIATSNQFGVGNSNFRIGTNVIKEVDTVPFGCWHRSWFDEVGLFDEELLRNQDDEFNARSIEHGGKLYLIPEIVVDYYGRDSFDKLWRTFYQYGLFKPMVNRKLHHPATIRQFIPPLFVLTLPISIVPYLLCVLSLSIYYHNIFLIAAFLIMHISYGIGYIYGYIRLIHNKKNTIQDNNR